MMLPQRHIKHPKWSETGTPRSTAHPNYCFVCTISDFFPSGTSSVQWNDPAVQGYFEKSIQAKTGNNNLTDSYGI